MALWVRMASLTSHTDHHHTKHFPPIINQQQKVAWSVCCIKNLQCELCWKKNYHHSLSSSYLGKARVVFCLGALHLLLLTWSQERLYLFTYMSTNTGIPYHWSFFRERNSCFLFEGLKQGQNPVDMKQSRCSASRRRQKEHVSTSQNISSVMQHRKQCLQAHYFFASLWVSSQHRFNLHLLLSRQCVCVLVTK